MRFQILFPEHGPIATDGPVDTKNPPWSPPPPPES